MSAPEYERGAFVFAPADDPSYAEPDETPQQVSALPGVATCPTCHGPVVLDEDGELVCVAEQGPCGKCGRTDHGFADQLADGSLCNETPEESAAIVDGNLAAMGVTLGGPRVPEGQSTNGVIRELVDALRILSAGVPGNAVEILSAATTRPVEPLQLTDREWAEVLGWLGLTRRGCQHCELPLIFVGDGPDPGWWRHVSDPVDIPVADTADCRGAVPVVIRP